MLDPATIPHFAQNFGFWLVDNEIVFSKVKSILRAQERKTRDVRYYFYDHIFASYDWAIEPQQSLQELYIARAKQLREKYDYLILLYSGGSDSSNALKTFVNHGIKLDEVAYWYTSYNEDTNITNLELLYAASGMLEKVRDVHGIPVRKIDERQFITRSNLNNADWVLGAEPLLVAAQISKEPMIYETVDWRNIAESGKRIGIILGLEKPRIFYDNGWHAAFLDVAHTWNTENQHISPKHITLESFYTSGDAPLITIKQSHVLKNHISKMYDLDYIKTRFDYTKNFKQDEYMKLCRDTLYPYWDDNTYSLGKSINKPPLTQKYEWLWNSNTDISNNYLDGLRWLNNIVDPYWCNSGDFYKGFVGAWSRRYSLDG